MEKLEIIHKFICKFGEIYKNPEIMQYKKQVADIESLLPGDVVHKILTI